MKMKNSNTDVESAFELMIILWAICYFLCKVLFHGKIIILIIADVGCF